MTTIPALKRLIGLGSVERADGGAPMSRSHLRELLLSEHELFRDVDPRQMERVAERLHMQHHRRGSSVYEPGNNQERLFILKAGRVRLFRLAADGRKLTLIVAEPGSAFGEMSLLGQSMAGTYAEAVDDCILCVMTRDDLETIVQEMPLLAMRFMELLAGRLKQAEDRLEQVAFQPIAARVAQALLQLANDQGDVEGFSQQELAEYVGASRESVTRTLIDFKTAGLIGIQRRCITVLDRPGIAARAEALEAAG